MSSQYFSSLIKRSPQPSYPLLYLNPPLLPSTLSFYPPLLSPVSTPFFYALLLPPSSTPSFPLLLLFPPTPFFYAFLLPPSSTPPPIPSSAQTRFIASYPLLQPSVVPFPPPPNPSALSLFPHLARPRVIYKKSPANFLRRLLRNAANAIDFLPCPRIWAPRNLLEVPSPPHSF